MLSQNPVVPSAASISGNVLAFPALTYPSEVPPPEAPPLRPIVAGRDGTLLPALAPGAALAHDARNALASVVLIAGLLGEPGLLPSPHQHYARDLEALAQALSSMVERLAGALESGVENISTVPPVEHAREVSATDAITGCAGMLQAIAGSRVAVHVSTESKLPPLAIETGALQRVLLNLVKNAVEAMPEGGMVRVTGRRALSRSAPAVLVHVSDNGPGIPEHALAHIFKPGFSSKRAMRTAEESCGLGLAIVRELVEASGGAVEVASTRRRGTIFELRLPCITGDQAGREGACTSVTGANRHRAPRISRNTSAQS